MYLNDICQKAITCSIFLSVLLEPCGKALRMVNRQYPVTICYNGLLATLPGDFYIYSSQGAKIHRFNPTPLSLSLFLTFRSHQTRASNPHPQDPSIPYNSSKSEPIKDFSFQNFPSLTPDFNAFPSNSWVFLFWVPFKTQISQDLTLICPKFVSTSCYIAILLIFQLR